MLGLRVWDLSKSYRDNVAVDGVSFSASSGDFIGLLGANGAGKSTLIKLLSGVIMPCYGDAELNGYSIVKRRRDAQAQIGYLPESPSGYEELTVAEFLTFSANAHGLFRQEKIRAVDKICCDLKLVPIFRQKLGELSKGLRQRAWLAQALIHDPEILFLDEPTDGLDPIQKVELRQYISALSDERIILMSTHILEEAEAMCGRILVMKKGKLAKDGSIGFFRDDKGRLEKSIIKHAS